MAKELPSVDYLRQRLAYAPDTGALTWLHCAGIRATWNTKFAGRQAGYVMPSTGYVTVSINNARYLAHRVAWAIHFGEDPLTAEIDHINGDRQDNRIANLRCVSRRVNARNQALRTNNTSGRLGVYWEDCRRRWHAQIMVDGNCIFLGRYCEYSEAVSAREAAEIQHAFHENHGRRAAG